MHHQYYIIKLYDLFQFRKEKPACGPLRKTKTKNLIFGPKVGYQFLAEGKPATSFSNWRSLFEKIRTDFINELGGRKGKD